MSSLSKSDLTRMGLLDAVERLSASGPMSKITMRAVAKEAGNSLGLAYRYFDSKEELLGAVLDRAAEHITQNLKPDDRPEEMALEAWQRMAERPIFARLFTWLVLEHHDVTQLMSGHPFLQNAAIQAKLAGDHDPATAAAAVGVVVLGGGVFAPALNRAANKAPDDDSIYPRLAKAVRATQMIDQA